jgi:hypothetical protein
MPGCVTIVLITSSHGGDHEQQRRDRVPRHAETDVARQAPNA